MRISDWSSDVCSSDLMGVLVDFLQVQSKPVRDLAARRLNKDENRRLASRFDVEYVDGTREQGYGGYRYDGRWVPVAHRLIDHYGLRPGDRVLDIGCAKGFLGIGRAHV